MIASDDQKILFLDCASGIAGDMLIGAFVDLGLDFNALQEKLLSLPLGDVEISLQAVKKKGFAAKKFDVAFPPQHAHRHLSDVEKILDASQIGERAIALAKRIFVTLGQAEATVHGSELKKVHFHEVGAVDSIIDIAGIAIALDTLNIQQVFCSAVTTGFGSITIAHGTVSVPAPATALLLQGIPTLAGAAQGELATPTGAAVLAAFANPVLGLPEMKILAVGMGAGTKDLPDRPNVVRAYLGQARIQSGQKLVWPEQDASQTLNPTNESSAADSGNTFPQDQLWQLDCNIDDATGQQIAFCQKQLFDAGVNDCFVTAIQMKKNRPASLLTVLCDDTHLSTVEHLLFTHTPTIGIRRHRVFRSILPREIIQVTTLWGDVWVKFVQRPKQRLTFCVEYDDCQSIATKHHLTLDFVRSEIENTVQELIANKTLGTVRK